MDYQIIEERLVAIVIHNSFQLTPVIAKALIEAALSSAGFSPWEKTEINVFEGGRDMLLLATPAAECEACIADYALPFFNRYFTD